MVGTIGQPKNTHLGSLHTAATSENLVSLSVRSWQVAKVADNTLLFLFLQTATMGKAYDNYPAQLAPLSSEKTQQ